VPNDRVNGQRFRDRPRRKINTELIHLAPPLSPTRRNASVEPVRLNDASAVMCSPSAMPDPGQVFSDVIDFAAEHPDTCTVDILDDDTNRVSMLVSFFPGQELRSLRIAADPNEIPAITSLDRMIALAATSITDHESIDTTVGIDFLIEDCDAFMLHAPLAAASMPPSRPRNAAFLRAIFEHTLRSPWSPNRAWGQSCFRHASDYVDRIHSDGFELVGMITEDCIPGRPTSYFFTIGDYDDTSYLDVVTGLIEPNSRWRLMTATLEEEDNVTVGPNSQVMNLGNVVATGDGAGHVFARMERRLGKLAPLVIDSSILRYAPPEHDLMFTDIVTGAEVDSQTFVAQIADAAVEAVRGTAEPILDASAAGKLDALSWNNRRLTEYACAAERTLQFTREHPVMPMPLETGPLGPSAESYLMEARRRVADITTLMFIGMNLGETIRARRLFGIDPDGARQAQSVLDAIVHHLSPIDFELDSDFHARTYGFGDQMSRMMQRDGRKIVPSARATANPNDTPRYVEPSL
jgi:hypothetical protein